jgi:N-acetyl-anhydromuramyl-L-alanine amidase AmpD
VSATLYPGASQDPALQFHDLPALTSPPPWIVGHWTGGERGAKPIYDVLQARKLSIHFTVDLAGTVVQHAPLDRRCSHAGSVGNRGLGVEIANMGFPRADGTSPRPFDVRVINGAKVRAVRYTDAELAAWVALCEWCAQAFGWPRQVPRELRQLTPAEAARWRGALEHLHLSRRKADGGGHLSAALVAAGWAAVDP